jgi:hypothetical protein
VKPTDAWGGDQQQLTYQPDLELTSELLVMSLPVVGMMLAIVNVINARCKLKVKPSSGIYGS